MEGDVSFGVIAEVPFWLMEDIVFSASEVVGGTDFWEEFLECRSGVWSLE